MRTHHIRALAELDTLGPAPPEWAAVMAQRRRKALVVCPVCHDHIHTGQPVMLTE